MQRELVMSLLCKRFRTICSANADSSAAFKRVTLHETCGAMKSARVLNRQVAGRCSTTGCPDGNGTPSNGKRLRPLLTDRLFQPMQALRHESTSGPSPPDMDRMVLIRFYQIID